jgi:glutamyl-Q tRNA(Asp) synthetase
MTLTTRFAPSPTGHLHLGHAFAALIAWRRARETGGRFLLRIEDIDRARCRPEFAIALVEDLAWLGLDWDGDVRVQSAHLDEYQRVLDDLRARGPIYPCFCTRTAILRDVAQSASAPHAPDGAPLYPGTCRGIRRDIAAARIAAGEAHAWRLDVRQAVATVAMPLRYREEGEAGDTICEPARFGDVVLARKDAPASYHLCVCHDDALQGVTLVTRGVDLRPVTDLHRLLYALMGWTPPTYAHHPLRTDAAGRRLAKRDKAATLRELRRAGVSPAEVRRMALGSGDGFDEPGIIVANIVDQRRDPPDS